MERLIHHRLKQTQKESAGKGSRSYHTLDDLKVNLSAYVDKPPAILVFFLGSLCLCVSVVKSRYVSVQKRSLKYLSPESHRIVTITAG